MTSRRLTLAAALLVVAPLAACADLTTTGVPAGSDGAALVVDPVVEQAEEIEYFARSLLGMTEEAAQKSTEEAGYQFRVVSRDGKPLPTTMDLRTDRINVAIVDDQVTEATVG